MKTSDMIALLTKLKENFGDRDIKIEVSGKTQIFNDIRLNAKSGDYKLIFNSGIEM